MRITFFDVCVVIQPLPLGLTLDVVSCNTLYAWCIRYSLELRVYTSDAIPTFYFLTSAVGRALPYADITNAFVFFSLSESVIRALIYELVSKYWKI